MQGHELWQIVMHVESVEDGRENSFGYSKETEGPNNETLF